MFSLCLPRCVSMSPMLFPSRRSLCVSLASLSQPGSPHSLPGQISASLRYQQRKVTPSLKKKVTGLQKETNQLSVVGYCTANSYNLLSLSEKLVAQGVYQTQPMVEELAPVCLYATAKYKVRDEEKENPLHRKDIYFYENGSVIFWNVPDLERDSVLNFVKSVENDGYSEETILEESEMMNFEQTEETTRLKRDGTILLNQQGSVLEKYAFADGIAASVKLGVLEATLDRIIDSIEHISEDMKKGTGVKLSQDEILQKTGEIFALRHVLNLSSDLLDTPDFYWDREDLERLYQNTCVHLAISKRTRLMNEKLNHCYELMELIRTQISDKHHVRLEWFIIILIMIEVFFEFMHVVERYGF